MKMIKTSKIATLSLLIAIILLLAFTPFGYLRTFGLSIQLITIPVAVGACLFGADVGLILGFVFGLTSFAQAFGLEPFGTTLFSINPLGTFIMCIIPRLLAGFLPGLLSEKLGNNSLKPFAVSFLVAFLNTLFFMIFFLAFFWGTEFVQSLNKDGKNIILFVFVFVGINGVVEWVSTTVVGGVVSKAVMMFHVKH